MTDWSPLNIVLWSNSVPWMSLTEVPSYSFLICSLDSIQTDGIIESILHLETQQNAYKLELNKHYKQAAETMLQALVLVKSSLEYHPKIVFYIQPKLMGCKFVEVILSWVDFYIRRNQKELTYELLKITNSYTSSSKKYPLKNKRLLRIRTLILTATYYIKETKYSSAQECLHRGFKYLNSSQNYKFYHAIILSLIALCSHETKDYKQALKNSMKSYKILSAKDRGEYDNYAVILLYNIGSHHLDLYQKPEAASVISTAFRILQNLENQNGLESKVLAAMELVGDNIRTRQDLGIRKIPETDREDSKYYEKSYIRLDKKQRLASGSKKPSRVRIHKHHLFSKFLPYTPSGENFNPRTGRSVPSRKTPNGDNKKGSRYNINDDKKNSQMSNRNHTVDSAHGISSRFRADFNIKNNAALVIQKYWRIYHAERIIGKMICMEYDRFKISAICTLNQAANFYAARSRVCRLAVSYIKHQLFTSVQLIKTHQKTLQLKSRKRQIQMVQACLRGYLIRRSIKIITLAAVKIQACFKGNIQRKKYQKLQKKAVNKSVYLDYEQTQRIIMSPRQAAVVIQSRYKGYSVRIARKRESSALKIQRMYSGYSVRNQLKTFDNKCIIIQAAIRRRIHKKRYRCIKESVDMIQRIWRGYKARSKLNLMQSSAIQIQSVYRGYRDRKELAARDKSARVIQLWLKLLRNA